MFSDGKYILVLGHISHICKNVLGICDIISIWAWAHIFSVLVLMMCTVWQWAYVRHMSDICPCMHGMYNNSLIRIALSVVRLLLELLEVS